MTQARPAPPAPLPSPARAAVGVTSLGVAAFLYVTVELLPVGLLHVIADDLGTSRSAIGLLVTGYAAVVVVATLPLTRWTRAVPRRPLLMALLAVLVVGSAVSATARTYTVLLVARLVTALSQALFWAVVTPVAGGLVREEVRGRALSAIYGGSTLAVVLGVPLATWAGERSGWPVAFAGSSVLALVVLVLLGVVLPSTRPGEGAADRGSRPDRGRAWSVVAATAVAITGVFVALTYVSPFLIDVTGVAPEAVAPVLLVRGVAGILGVAAVGLVVDRHGWAAFVVVMALQVVALLGQWLLADSAVGTIAALTVGGFSLAGLASVVGARILQLAPGRTDVASAMTATAYNVGIMSGAAAGSALLPLAGVRSTALVGAGFVVLALVVVLAEPWASSVRRREQRVAEERAEVA